MLKLINSKRIDYHSNLISNATKDNRAFFSGSAKAYATNGKFTWSGDMLFKHKLNLKTNPHVGYLSFFSDHDIAIDEYGSIEPLRSSYPFFASYQHKYLSKYGGELSDNQYEKIGQKSVEAENVYFIDTFKYSFGSGIPVSDSHNSGYAPIFRTHGYQFNSNNEFMWIRNIDTSMSAPPDRLTYTKNPIEISDNRFTISMINNLADISSNDSIMLALLSSPSVRVFNYFPQDNKKRFYFKSSNQWSVYTRDRNSFVGGKYLNDIGIVSCYNDQGKSIQSINGPTFYPNVTIDGVFEPAKCIIDWANDRVEEGSVFINTGVCNQGEADDQSRLVFSVCGNMLSADTIIGNKFEVLKKDGSNTIYNGIDFETERQRRYSSVVTTQPYHVVQPINNSEVVDYCFVDMDGNPVNHGSEASFEYKPDMFIQVKSSLAMVNAIEQKIKSDDYNTDVINVFEIDNPQSASLSTNSVKYFDFDGNYFFNRQDFCLDDLLVISGQERRARFRIDKQGDQSNMYSEHMLVNGAGFISKPVYDSNGRYTGAVKQVLSLYCSNFEFNEEGTPNSWVEIISGMSPSRTLFREKFYPVIKLPGVNGYVKLIEQSRHVPQYRDADGRYVTTYVVEFPYCPGSFSERVKMSFVGVDGEKVFRKTFVQYKFDYLFAGSHEIDSAGKYDDYNERKSFSYDDLQCPMSAYVNRFVDDITNTEKYGGDQIGFVGYPGIVQRRNRNITYPKSLVFFQCDPDLVSLVKRNDSARMRIIHSYDPQFSDVDMKIILIPSAKMWKYDDGRYSSYINHENPSFVFEMDVSALFNDYTKHQREYAILPDMKRFIYGYAKAMAATKLSSTGIELPYNNGFVSHPVESSTVIEVWDNHATVLATESATWRPISISLNDDGKSPGELIVGNLAATSQPVSVGDYVSCNFQYKSRGDTSFTMAGIDVLNYDRLTNKALYDMVNKRVYHIINTIVEQDLSLTIYFKYDILNDPAIPAFNPSNYTTLGQVCIHEPIRFISRSKENEIYTSEASTAEPNGIQRRMIDIRNTVLDSNDQSDLLRYVDSNGKIKFRVRVLRAKEFPKTFISKDVDQFQYTNVASDTPDQTDINPWYGIATPGWDYKLAGTKEDVSYFGMNYFQLLSK